ncbi:MAG TPA: enoyl-CoA hydratase-related protein, partial [Usitatibacter sp.]|nr:enoyl-CoA hydratase-related protein [Usitatibacter sp.]
MTATYAVHGNVAVITLDNPPVNGMGFATRSATMRGLDSAAADAAVQAIVIRGANGLFSGGADIREFGTEKARAEPTLMQLIAAAESSAKPVVAAIQGVCMGGGLELSLGCHYRVVTPDAKVALPEVKLGLIPGAGGTQRLPRAVGAEAALGMIVGGEQVHAALHRESALVDAVIEGDLLAGAVAFARDVAVRLGVKRLRDRSVTPPAADFFAQAREKVAKARGGLAAPQRCIDAVEASISKPFEEGLRYERELFLALMDSTESKAMRHAFFAERAASKIPGVAPDTPVRRVEKVAVIGAGTMGGGIAMSFVNAGIPVVLLEMKQDALDRGLATIRRNYEGAVKRGKMD